MNLIVIEEITALCNTLDEKTVKSLSIDVLLRLLNKIRDLENEELDYMLLELKHHLSTHINENTKSISYRRVFRALQRKLIKDLNLHQRGSLQGQYLSLGIALGTALGITLASNNPAMLAIGIGAGLAIGSGIGKQKEQLAAKEDRLY